MTIYQGKCASGGIALGRLYIIQKDSRIVRKHNIDSRKKEVLRYINAKEKAKEQLQELYEKATKETDKEYAQIFQVHQMILDDDMLHSSIMNRIESEYVNSEYAVYAAGNELISMFMTKDDDVMKSRADDIKDITERLLSILTNTQSDWSDMPENAIVASKDLTPSETVQFDKDKIVAFITQKGSAHSHTAILARTMNIPAIIQSDIELKDEYNGCYVIIDGLTGTIYLDPDEEIINDMLKKQQEEMKQKELLRLLKGKENITLDGRKIDISANISCIRDISLALSNDADGIGLFRSEFIYLENKKYPKEEEQFQIYKSVLEKMDGKRVIIRTLDIGADKQADYFHIDKEENPTLGYRGIRICLDRKDLFKIQLRALYRASIYGNLSIMFPMIISLEEVLQIKEIIKEVFQELTNQKILYHEVEIGIMIETPAAAMVSDILAKEVDFFSIGTNDLTQYTLAIDRQNQKLEHIYDARHLAVLRFIKMIVDNGHKQGIWVGICGELAADMDLTEEFLLIGVDELSISPNMVLSLRNKVRSLNITKNRTKLKYFI